MKGRMRVWISIGALALAAFAPARAAIRADYTVLDNGLKVILFQDKQAPTVACRLFYVTGSVHENFENNGIAHLLEHMLFKGTKKVGVKDPEKDAEYITAIDALMEKYRSLPPADTASRVALKRRYDSLIAEERKLMIKYELWEAYEKNGGTGLNAFTSDLMTAYFVTLPKNKIDLYLWLESDRMQNAVLREFYSERDVVMEERRMRVEDSPTGRYWESLMALFYEAHPFRLPTIGYPSNIRNLTREMADEHYRKYYKPNNAILVLVGDFDPASTLADIKKYFGGIPRGSEFPPVVVEEPQQPGAKRMTVLKNSAKPRMDILFHTPGFDHPDLYALDIVEGVLSGKSGRLYKKLVKEKKIALNAAGGNGVDKYTSNFSIEADLDGNPQPEKVEKAVWEVLTDLGQKPITERELTRAKNQVVARTQRQLLDKEELATELAFWEMRGGWDYINRFPDGVEKVTAQQVQDVCKKYFTVQNSTTGLILPEAPVPGAHGALGPTGAAGGKAKTPKAAKPKAAAAQEGGAQ
ncbi:MAG: insulinase family protein [Fibrobacteres bacterium]|nr:insulinase family protein [Fibrobacterota bacterium]